MAVTAQQVTLTLPSIFSFANLGIGDFGIRFGEAEELNMAYNQVRYRRWMKYRCLVTVR